MRSLWNAFLDSLAPHAAEAAPARKNGRLEFERLETRENPAGQADAIVWGAGWQQYHVGSDNHFHIQYTTNGGTVKDVDLTAALGSNATFTAGHAAVTATTFGNSPYVFARASDSHVHAFYWTGSKWAESNLSQAAGYNAGAQGYQLAAHVWNGIPHVFYMGGGLDNHVHELYWSAATGWKGLDLSVVGGSPVAADDDGPITALVGAGNTEHVYYQAADNHLRELKWTSGIGWQDADISGAGQAMNTNAFELSAFSIGSLRYVFYQGANNHVYQLVTSGPDWVATDVTQSAGAANTRGATDLQAYYRNGRITVAYVGADNHVHTLSRGLLPGWTDKDLTAATGAPNVHSTAAPVYSGNLTALVDANSETLFYVDSGVNRNRFYTTDPLVGWQHFHGPNF